MSRRRRVHQREVDADAVYNDLTVARFINKLMWSGKKSLSQSIVYSALDELKTKSRASSPSQYLKSGRQLQTLVRGPFATCRWGYLPSACGCAARTSLDPIDVVVDR